MATPLGTYVQDHLAGAQFAVKLLEDLQEQADDERINALARALLKDVEADRTVLQDFAARIGEDSSLAKEAAAWIVQKLSGVKLAPGDALGAFEAVETLCLGIQGKLALWKALATLRDDDPRVRDLDLTKLAIRASEQHGQIEALRLALAPMTLGDPGRKRRVDPAQARGREDLSSIFRTAAP
jgi:hypothetical protein